MFDEVPHVAFEVEVVSRYVSDAEIELQTTPLVETVGNKILEQTDDEKQPIYVVAEGHSDDSSSNSEVSEL